MKLFHLGAGRMSPPLNAYIHDAYHPLPNQLGEGAIGTGSLVRWTEPKAACERTIGHAICVDDYGAVAGWHLRTEKNIHELAAQNGETWRLELNETSPILITEESEAITYQLAEQEGEWTLNG